jgi:hypothetical protein
MAISQFADISKDLYTRIKIIENMVKGNLYKEAQRQLSSAEESCGNLESLVEPDNKVQARIVSNRRMEIHWLEDSIKHGLIKRPVIRKKKRIAD